MLQNQNGLRCIMIHRGVAEGYRVTKEVKKGHELLFKGLTFTVDRGSKHYSPLQVARIVRNQTTYSSVGNHKKPDIDKLLGSIRQLRADVEKWLGREHPDLI
jgi:hypothetical protein